MNKKYLILIVIYNETIDESLTYKSLLGSSKYLNNSKLVIWDNSKISQKMNKNKISFFDEIEYIHTPENLSLSKIYNKVIQLNNGFGYMIILDQDSSFSINYFQEIEKATAENKDINLFLPIVKSSNTIVSPGNYKIFKGSYWKKEKYGKINSKDILAINSGMVINFNYLRNLFTGYDERLRFYGTDTFFMLNYSEHNKYIYIINYILEHDSALLNKNESIEKILKRERELLNAWILVNENNKFHLLLTYIYTIYKTVKLSLKYRTTKLIRGLIR